MATYSMLNIVGTIVGPGLVATLGNGAGTAEEGIEIEPTGDQSGMVIGADGSGMHSLYADTSRKVSIKILKTSPLNAILQNAFNYQTTSAILHGHNHIVFSDVSRGDLIKLADVAFKKQPVITYAKDGKYNEWLLDAIKSDTLLGVGTPAV